jgi:phospholipase/lecithinase/hemolysin
MSASRFLRRLAPFAASLVLALHGGPGFAQPSGIDRLVVFGASLSDPGNAFVWLSDPLFQHCGTRLNVPPYDQLDDLLVPDGPYARGGHHLSNGATWAEALARQLALAGNARPALRSSGTASNYAVSGARAVMFPCRFNLPDQIARYAADFPRTSPQSLITLEIGGNDVRDALAAAASGGDPAPFLQNALAGLANSIAALYGQGARRFLLLNLPNLARAPSVQLIDRQLPGAADLASQLSLAFNAGLIGVVQYANGLAGADARLVDIHGLLEQIVASPASFGFENATDACVTPNVPPFHCAHADRYVFWDGVHPTRAVHALIAQQAMAVISAP